MSSQTQIAVGKGEVLGVDPEASGLLRVRLPLTPRPDDYWAQIFENGPPGVSYSLSMHPPHLEGGSVVIRPPDGEVEKYVASVRERVEGTNREYERRVLPQLNAESERREQAAQDEERRLREAQERLDELG